MVMPHSSSMMVQRSPYKSSNSNTGQHSTVPARVQDESLVEIGDDDENDEIEPNQASRFRMGVSHMTSINNSPSQQMQAINDKSRSGIEMALDECTFQPQINYSKYQSQNQSPLHRKSPYLVKAANPDQQFSTLPSRIDPYAKEIKSSKMYLRQIERGRPQNLSVRVESFKKLP